MHKLVLSIEMSKTGADSVLNGILSNLKWLGKIKNQPAVWFYQHRNYVIPGTRQQVPRKTENTTKLFMTFPMYVWFISLPSFLLILYLDRL